MCNIKKIIKKIIKKRLKQKTIKKTKHFATVKKINKCPFNNKCLIDNIIKATIRRENKTKNYFGSTGGTQKKMVQPYR